VRALRKLATPYATLSPGRVVERLDRKQEEVDNRFYRSHQQQPDIYDADLLRRIRRLHDFYEKS
jgi:hypothetical protein